MSLRAVGGFIRPGYNPLRVPNAPTIGTASSSSGTTASVAFTAPSCVGGGAITSYTAISSPGCKVGTAASSPVTVACLTTNTAYTFRVFATNSYGPSIFSGSSNSVTPVAAGQQAYTTAGTYSWVAPADVTSVSVVVVGGGGGGGWGGTTAGGGGALAYKNNISVTPGTSYTVVVGAGGSGRNYPNQGTTGGQSYFINTSTVQAAGGLINQSNNSYVGDGGGYGGFGRQAGGGAGGYSGNGGLGGGIQSDNSSAGAGGGGGGGAGGYFETDGAFYDVWSTSGSGGGVGILGQGANGARGVYNSLPNPGGGGSGGQTPSTPSSGGPAAAGGAYGGGGGNGYTYADICGGIGTQVGGNGGVGAVRIIWPGTSRQFPSTNTGNL